MPRTRSGVVILPTSCRVAASRRSRSSSRDEPHLGAEQERVGDHPADVAAGVGVALLERLGESGDHVEELPPLRRPEPGVLQRRRQDGRELAHPPEIAGGEPVAVHRVEELDDADDAPLSAQRHGEDGAGLELARGVPLPARIGGHVVDHLGLAGLGDAADDPLPHRHPQAADVAGGAPPHDAEEELPPLLVELPDRARLGPADLLRVLQRQLQHRLEVERAGELDADVEQRLVFGEAAVGLERRPEDGRSGFRGDHSALPLPRRSGPRGRSAAPRRSGSARRDPSSGSAGWPPPAPAGSRASGCSAAPAPPASA